MTDYFLYGTGSGGALNEPNLAESVEDVVTNLFPLYTPIQSWLGTKQVRSIFHLWPIDTFNNITRTAAMFSAGTVATNLQKPEGYTPTTSTPLYAGQLKGVVELHLESFGVTGTMRAVYMHGFVDKFVDEAEKMTKKVLNDEELSFTWSPGSTEAGTDLESGGGTTLTRQTMGLGQWVTQTGLQRTKIGTGTSFTDTAGNVFSSSTARAIHPNSLGYCKDLNGLTLDRDSFFDLMLNWRNIGGRPDGAVGLCSSKVKQAFTTFAMLPQGNINERKVDAAGKIVYDSVDAYVTDFGLHFLNSSFYLDVPSQTSTISQSTGTTTVAWDENLWFFMPRYFKIATLRGTAFEMLAHTGDHHRGQIVSERGLMCQNTLASCGVVNALAA